MKATDVITFVTTVVDVTSVWSSHLGYPYQWSPQSFIEVVFKDFFPGGRSSWNYEEPPEKRGKGLESVALHCPFSFAKTAPYIPAYALKLHGKFILKKGLKSFL